jgi:predicted nuclease of predicted toxin-antitoxin system
VIWDYALAQELLIITKDEDFAARSVLAANSPVIVWLRIGNAANRALLFWLGPRWKNIQLLLEAGQRLIEVK